MQATLALYCQNHNIGFVMCVTSCTFNHRVQHRYKQKTQIYKKTHIFFHRQDALVRERKKNIHIYSLIDKMLLSYYLLADSMLARRTINSNLLLLEWNTSVCCENRFIMCSIVPQHFFPWRQLTEEWIRKTMPVALALVSHTQRTRTHTDMLQLSPLLHVCASAVRHHQSPLSLLWIHSSGECRTLLCSMGVCTASWSSSTASTRWVPPHRRTTMRICTHTYIHIYVCVGFRMYVYIYIHVSLIS